MSTAQAHRITLKGSTDIVVEFFDYSVNSILFQRGIYPAEDFRMVKKYGLNMLVTTDDALQVYLRRVLDQLREWLLGGKVSKLVLALVSVETREVVERWQFDIHVASKSEQMQRQQGGEGGKSDATVQTEIQAVLRQITASVTFLPVLEERCTFNLLVYTDRDAEVPVEWGDTDPHYVTRNAEQVKLRSFSTNVHKVDAIVSYRLDQD